MTSPRKPNPVTGYQLQDKDGHLLHSTIFSPDERVDAYAAAREMALALDSVVKVHVIRSEFVTPTSELDSELPTVYEVTVPLVVKVLWDNDIDDYRVVSTGIDTSYPGFHSEAEECGGVWNPDHEMWFDLDSDISDVAWDHMNSLIAGKPSVWVES